MIKEHYDAVKALLPGTVRVHMFTVGKQYRVSGFTPDTFDTAARLPVKEIL